MPSSTTAARCSGRSRSRVSGTPMSLLKLPAVASAASPQWARSTEASIWVVVVLPLLPVTAISGPVKRWRQAAVGHLDTAQASLAQATFGQGGAGAGCGGLVQEVVGIETLAPQGHEQVAGLQRAGVGVHPLQGGVGLAQQARAGQGGGHFSQGEHAGRQRPSPLGRRASSMIIWSENGWRTPSISW